MGDGGRCERSRVSDLAWIDASVMPCSAGPFLTPDFDEYHMVDSGGMHTTAESMIYDLCSRKMT